MSDKTVKNIPKLRFPEFVHDGEWEETTIEKISKKVTAGGTPSTSKKEYWSGSIRWMNSGELNLKRIYEVEGRITEEGLQNSSTKLIPKNCILIGLAGQGKTRGTVATNMVELCTNQSIGSIFPNKKSFVSDFLFHNLDNRYDELRNLSAGGGGRGGLNLQIIKSIPIRLPKLKEQQKIADCLSSIDYLVTTQTKKVELLKKHKKALLQNLFPKDDESVPKYRFSEFINDGDWEEKPLKKVCNITNGKSNAQDHDENGIYPLFDRSEVIKKSNNFLFDCEAVIIPGEGVRFVPKYYKGKFDLHQRAYVLQNFKENGKFVYHFMDFTKDILASQAVLSTVLSLRLPILENFTIKLPKSKEQQKIANCLTSIDEEINLQTQKLEILKEHKKGLLQQLFPSNEVING